MLKKLSINHNQVDYGEETEYLTFLAASCMASGSNRSRLAILEDTISCNCWKVYGWNMSLVSPFRGRGREQRERELLKITTYTLI